MRLLIILLVATPLIARQYPIGKVVKVIDADTVDVVIDLGFGITIEERLRLYRIDAWEIRGEQRPRGIEAKEFLIMKLTEAETIHIDVPEKERGKYGRVLATVYADGVDLNALLVSEGHAEFADY